jgi:sugar lactone lactonase YvrE
MKKNILLLSTFITAFAISIQSAIVLIEVPDLYPDGVAYDEGSNAFFVSSVKNGDIGIVDQNGIYGIFYGDPGLKSSFGMKVDKKRNVLWVCISDPNFSDNSDSITRTKMARVIGLDLASAKKTADIDLSMLLPGRHFVNDLALDSDGNIYVTDSFSPAIYKIDSTGTATVFSKHEKFIPTGEGLNGIVFHPDGFLLVSHYSNGTILKVPLASPEAVTEVGMELTYPGADGLLLDAKNNLVLVQNQGANRIYRLDSRDRWKTAIVREVTAETENYRNPTTATMVEDNVYVLNARLDELTDSTKAPSSEFSIQIVRFKNGRQRHE